MYVEQEYSIGRSCPNGFKEGTTIEQRLVDSKLQLPPSGGMEGHSTNCYDDG